MRREVQLPGHKLRDICGRCSHTSSTGSLVCGERGKALGSGKRLELLAQGERSVEALAQRAADLLARVQAGEVVVLDVRPAEEYAAGHVPGAGLYPGR
nr:rhodanese-like domain-containing protein [Kibdelosporangium sp. MJ126-NF4]CEL13270.1 Transcriptional regulator, ArsR family [Kibdelosporangium sp. MJ126-NF4]CTQ98962.1 Transcriptional regulator, ArsR family [Kibdelosporangium sp. MJ126-NF4]